ncbi:MAG: methyltransferase type 12 [Prosthecochloris sp.]|uniref:class I SAM-dependent methyltransferase n=1 Tax=Prosthecochloris sp. TaxID=290513 RepID=UPI0013C83330|nr:class I SAM-dependent methyltransferase [Prosthecochloris sp.]NEX11632.1 methyltransferase type 12 [Prosthecochloris sp.]
MNNPWLDISLSDYESHMSLPTVDQAVMTATEFSRIVSQFTPESVAVIGCAGGNGFDAIPASTRRVVGVDINKSYIARAAERYEKRIPGIEFHRADVQSDPLSFDPVELIYASLVFEYVSLPETLENLARVCLPGGHLVTLLQQPSTTMTALTPSPYTSIQSLSQIMRLVPPSECAEYAASAGFTLKSEKRVTIKSGKSFLVQIYRKQEHSSPGQG